MVADQVIDTIEEEHVRFGLMIEDPHQLVHHPQTILVLQRQVWRVCALLVGQASSRGLRRVDRLEDVIVVHAERWTALGAVPPKVGLNVLVSLRERPRRPFLLPEPCCTK